MMKPHDVFIATDGRRLQIDAIATEVPRGFVTDLGEWVYYRCWPGILDLPRYYRMPIAEFERQLAEHGCQNVTEVMT